MWFFLFFVPFWFRAMDILFWILYYTIYKANVANYSLVAFHKDTLTDAVSQT